MTSGLPTKMLATSLILLLNVLVLGSLLPTKMLPTKASQPNEWRNKHELLLFHRSRTNPNKIRITGTGTPRSMKTPHCNWNWVVFLSDLERNLRGISAIDPECHTPFGQGIG